MKQLNLVIAAVALSSLILGCNSSTQPPSSTNVPSTTAAAPSSVTTSTSATNAPANTPQATAEKMIDALAKNDFTAATQDFDVTMQGALPAEKLKEVWNQIIGKMGTFQARENSKTEKIQAFDAVFVNCRFEKDTVALQVTVDSAGKVSGFFIKPKF